MEPKTLPGLTELAGAPLKGQRINPKDADQSWFRALAEAWGQTLDQQAQKITDLSANIGDNGTENPSDIVELTAESLRMQFLSNSQATSTNAVGQALETMARKQ